MIAPDKLREYHRQLAQFCLQRAGECTAAELLEQMGVTAISAGHPRDCYGGLTTATVAGLMRELDRSGLVRRGENRNNQRYGRPEPVWIAQGPATDAPAAPTTVPSGAAAPPAPLLPASAPPVLGGLSQAQRLALLQIEFEEMKGRIEREWQAFHGRAARVLGLPAEGQS